MTDDCTCDGRCEGHALAQAQRLAGARFVAACKELAAAAAELADAEARYRTASYMAGRHDAMPPARELAADVALAALAPLRPYVGFVTEESGRRAAETLVGTGDSDD